MIGPESGDHLPASPARREFVGFAWQSDWSERVGILVEAYDVADAVSAVRDALPGWRVSLWNEEDASRAR